MNQKPGALTARLALPWWGRGLLWTVRILVGYVVVGLLVYGTMTLAADCSSGVYISPNPLFTGRECRQYQVSDGKNVSTPAEVCIKISPQERRATKQKI